MHRLILATLACVFVFVSLTDTADARRRWFRRRVYTNNYARHAVDYSGCETIQDQCQAEANYMAKYHVFGHVGVNLGNFEGCGWAGSVPNCATCTPRYGMTLVGDASAQDEYGRWYRVRAWQ